ncbi:hypothetical protein [Vibrio phage vB_VmeM-Yong XC32]|nr:hypothetical protein [Vibrio phage vB_VmeM-Yong XC31]QAX96531.1 hypothetical protein [Vibrio phage vB_VmeM-Yong XC32]QAX96849.1 hypothetical protein [Vibrio phage vB_VmeM-Yong MS31]QAX97154.1 hypothetical protein [Vibrio phage vB_VmeM-Yong MS32]
MQHDLISRKDIHLYLSNIPKLDWNAFKNGFRAAGRWICKNWPLVIGALTFGFNPTAKGFALFLAGFILSEVTSGEIAVSYIKGWLTSPSEFIRNSISYLAEAILGPLEEERIISDAFKINNLVTAVAEEGKILHSDTTKVWNNHNRGRVESMGPGRVKFELGGRIFHGVIMTERMESSSVRHWEMKVWTCKDEPKPFEELQRAADDIEPDDKDFVPMGSYGNEEIAFGASQKVPNLDDLILSDETRETIVGTLKSFEARAEFCDKNKLAHKLVILAHGEPGNGKSALAAAIAAQTGRALVTIDPSKLTNKTKFDLLYESAPDNVYLIEDIHRSETFSDKEAVQGKLSLSTILNVFNGAVPLHDAIIVMTTNEKDKLGKDLVRTGRIDFDLELPRLEPELINENIEKVTGFKANLDRPIRGADYYAILSEGCISQERMDMVVERVIKELPDLKDAKL